MISIDAGNTRIKALIFNQDGSVQHQENWPRDAQAACEAWLETVRDRVLIADSAGAQWNVGTVVTSRAKWSFVLDYAESVGVDRLAAIEGARSQYPDQAAPIGAGMAIRREAAGQWLADSADTSLSDRRGAELTSGGDNDIVFALLKRGWAVGYFPELTLKHLIPARRLTVDYLARINHGIQKSWVQVLAKYDACPWSPIPGWTVPLRQFKAWFTHRAWAGLAAHVRWRGACGQFDGLSGGSLRDVRSL